MLGLVASGPRKIKNGKNFDHLYPKVGDSVTMLKRDGSVYETLNLMEKIVKDYHWQTDKIAPLLRGKTIKETCLNIWTYVYNHYQYKLDKDGVEQLRTPARAWKDRESGIDCDCMSITVACMLRSLKVNCTFRITKYHAGWQHVYVVVPDKANGKDYIIDCVLDTPLYEKPYSQKHDHKMSENLNGLGIPVELLEGVGEINGCPTSYLGDIIMGTDFERVELLGLSGTEDAELQAIYNHLVKTRDYIGSNPQNLSIQGGAKAQYDMLNYAIKNWNTPNRDAALAVLEQEEEKWNNSLGLVDDGDEDSFDGLGRAKKAKKFFKKVKEAVQTVKKEIKETGGKIADKGKAAIKKVAKAIVKYNPVSLAMRGGFLLAVRVNLFKMATKLQKSPAAYAKVKKFFVDILQGKESALKNSIEKGSKAQLSGLGDPVTITAVTAAAVPIMKALHDINESSKGLTGIEEDYPNVFSWLDDNGFRMEGLAGLGDSVQDAANASMEAEVAKVASESNASNPDGKTEKDKGVITKFVILVKKWFSRKKASPAEQKALDEANREYAENQANPDAEADPNADPESGDGIVAKATQFIKENPVKAGIAIVAAVTVVALAVSPKARKAVGLGGVSGRKRKRRKSSKRRAAALAGSKKPKMIALK